MVAVGICLIPITYDVCKPRCDRYHVNCLGQSYRAIELLCLPLSQRIAKTNIPILSQLCIGNTQILGFSFGRRIAERHFFRLSLYSALFVYFRAFRSPPTFVRS
jgi:hypothetical protein